MYFWQLHFHCSNFQWTFLLPGCCLEVSSFSGGSTYFSAASRLTASLTSTLTAPEGKKAARQRHVTAFVTSSVNEVNLSYF